MKRFFFALLTLVLLTAPAFANVTVSDPYNNQSVGPAIQVIANANTTTCNKGVASMGVYINNNLVYVQPGTGMNHWLSVGSGWNHLVVQEWDYCGGSTSASMNVDAQGGSGSGGPQVSSGTQDGVIVTSPANNSTVSTQVSFVASGSTSCSSGVASMGIYINNNLVYTVQGRQLNHVLTLGTGANQAIVHEWDNCGKSATQTINLNVTNPGNTLWSVQKRTNWESWAQYPPAFTDCTGNCPGIGFWLTPNVSSPSYDGHSTAFRIAGSKSYTDVLWHLPLIGDKSSIPDTGHSLLGNLHNFTYDTDVYVTNLGVTQTLEFDIEMDINGAGMTFGTECNHLGGGSWDIWDNQDAHWVSAGVPCNLHQGWNHVTIHVQRGSRNQMFYQSITLNGTTYQIDRTYYPIQVPGGWWGLGINYQMDGNVNDASNTTFLDNLNFTYY